MEQGGNGTVAGLFATHGQAVAVLQDLHRIGLADREIVVGTPASGRYRLDVQEDEGLGSGVIDGIVTGTLLGAVIGALLIALLVPQAMENGSGAILLGILVGGFWGSFFGGLGGMAIKASTHSSAAQWCDIPERCTALLVIAQAGPDADAARKIMRRDGARTLLKQMPELEPVTLDSTPPATSVAGEGQSSSTAAQATETDGHARKIGIPRGAFLLLVLFLLAVSASWANVYLRVVWRA